MTASERPIRPRGRPLRDMPIEPEVMRRRPKPEPEVTSRPRPKKAKKRSPVLTFVTIVLLLVIALVAFWLVAGLFGGMLTLRTVTVEWPQGKSSYVDTAAVETAAALSSGDRIYAIRPDAVEAAVLRANPYLASVEVERRLPDTVAIVCTPREAAYYVAVDGEYFAISCDLVVLEQQRDTAAFAERGLIALRLPEVQSALIGQPLAFADSFDVSYLPPLLEAHRKSELYSETNLLRIDSRFDVRMIVRDSFAVTMGDSGDAERKLQLTAKMLEDEMFASGSGAFFDVTDSSRASAIPDMQTDYARLWRD